MEIFIALVVCGILLMLERLTYLWVWRRPQSFRAICEGGVLRRSGHPVDVLALVFYMFKLIQIGVFLGWCMVFGGKNWFVPAAGAPALAAGALVTIAGQILNVSVFKRLGMTGVFYGNKLGHEIPWQRGFPFSFLEHPQYVGTLMSVWGFFLIMRFPNPDWLALPLLQTVYYAAATRLES